MTEPLYRTTLLLPVLFGTLSCSSFKSAERGAVGPCGSAGAFYVEEAASSCTAYVGEAYGWRDEADAPDVQRECPQRSAVACCVAREGANNEEVHYAYEGEDLTVFEEQCIGESDGVFAWISAGTASSGPGIITAPAHASTVSGDVEIVVDIPPEAEAYQVDIGVEGEIESYSDGSWHWSWDTCTVEDGEHRLTAEATDLLGYVVGTDAVIVTVANPLEIRIVAPSGTVATHEVLVADASLDISGDDLTWELDGSALSGTVLSAGSRECNLECGACQRFEMDIDTSDWTAGQHTLTVSSTFDGGASDSATVTVAR